MKNVLKTNNQINEVLQASDAVLKDLIEHCSHISIPLRTNYYESLVSSIIGQQLSTRVADIIWNRVLGLLNGVMEPQSMIDTEDKALRDAGLSYPKIGYIKNLSESILNKKIFLRNFEEWTDDEIIKNLTQVKGIGIWTAEMFLIFSLGRTDVFSIGDGGLQRVIKSLYKLEENPTKGRLLEISNNWKPYRTFASLYLWEAINKGLI